MSLDELKAVQEKHKPIAAIDDPPTRFFNAMGNKQAELRRVGELWEALSNAIEQIEGLRDVMLKAWSLEQLLYALGAQVSLRDAGPDLDMLAEALNPFRDDIDALLKGGE